MNFIPPVQLCSFALKIVLLIVSGDALNDSDIDKGCKHRGTAVAQKGKRYAYNGQHAETHSDILQGLDQHNGRNTDQILAPQSFRACRLSQINRKIRVPISAI